MSAENAAVPSGGERKRLVFVCVENSCRSQMAEAFARRHGGSAVEAYSAGSSASGTVNPRAIASMAEVDYDLSTHASKAPDALPAGPFDVVVSMGCGDRCPALPAARRLDWEVEDPKDMPAEGFRAVRDEIEDRVRGLLRELGVGEMRA